MLTAATYRISDVPGTVIDSLHQVLHHHAFKLIQRYERTGELRYSGEPQKLQLLCIKQLTVSEMMNYKY